MAIDFTKNECDGPLVYLYHDGMYFLNNPIALMWAANHGFPGVARDFDVIAKIGNAKRFGIVLDDADPEAEGMAEYIDAARKVLEAS